MQEALLSLKALKGSRAVALLGDMKELGKKEKFFHRLIGASCARLKLDKLLVIGELAKHIGRGAEIEGFPKDNIMYCKTRHEAVKLLSRLLRPDDLLLVKGSRAMQLDKIVEKLRIGLRTK